MIKKLAAIIAISTIAAANIPVAAFELPMQIQPVNPVNQLDLTPQNLIGIPPKRATL